MPEGLQRSWVNPMTRFPSGSDLFANAVYGIDWSNIADQPAEINYRYAKKQLVRRQVRLRVPSEPTSRAARPTAGSRAWRGSEHGGASLQLGSS